MRVIYQKQRNQIFSFNSRREGKGEKHRRGLRLALCREKEGGDRWERQPKDGNGGKNGLGQKGTTSDGGKEKRLGSENSTTNTEMIDEQKAAHMATIMNGVGGGKGFSRLGKKKGPALVSLSIKIKCKLQRKTQLP